MPRKWLIALHAVFCIAHGNARHHYDSDEHDEEAAWKCAQIVADYFSNSEDLKSYYVEDYSESSGGNRLNVKHASLSGFYDIVAEEADLVHKRSVSELTMVLEVPELELSSYDLLEGKGGSHKWLHVNTAAKNVRFRLGIRYDNRGIEVFDCSCEGYDRPSVYIEENVAQNQKKVVSELSKSIFAAVLKRTVPQALSLVGAEVGLLDQLIAHDRYS
ncbi:uncharacterized protein LOC135400670 [Ornithodoros turicata]|uniref:uncharacterized protein LOC135400670 n=1 Tax=Ornithodoros turicata TaxID=34597 RepID=UPI003138D70F